MKYICKQLQCKQKVPETERPEALDSYPHLRDWLRTINLRPELIEVGSFLFPPSVTLAWVTVCVTFYVGSVCVHSHVHVEYLTHWPSQCLWSGQQFWTRTWFNFSLDKLLVVASKSSTQPAAIYIVVRRWRDWKVSVVQLCEEFVTSDRSAIVCILQQVGWFHWSGIFIREKICNNANWIQRKEKKTPQKINREKLVNRIQIEYK